MKKILVMMQHKLTSSQICELGVDTSDVEYLEDIQHSLFVSLANTPSSPDELWKLAVSTTSFLEDYLRGTEDAKIIFPIGSPAFQFALGAALVGNSRVTCALLWAHSVRESQEITDQSGAVKKVSIFRHQHFYGFGGGES